MKALILFILNLCVLTPAFAQGEDAVSQMGRISEFGGASLAMVLAMYWLRDANQRRVEECQRYAADLKVHAERLDTIVKILLKEGQNG